MNVSRMTRDGFDPAAKENGALANAMRPYVDPRANAERNSSTSTSQRTPARDPSEWHAQRISSASKRQHKPAQGKALGFRKEKAQAPTGRHIGFVANCPGSVPPFQGSRGISTHTQGDALGWLVGPFQGRKPFRNHTRL